MVAMLVFTVAAASNKVPTLSGTLDARLVLLGLALPLGILVLAVEVRIARLLAYDAVELVVGTDSIRIRSVRGAIEVIPFSEGASEGSTGCRLIGLVDRSSIPGRPPAKWYAIIYRRATALTTELAIPQTAFDAVLSSMASGGRPLSPETRLGPNGVGQVRAWAPLP
jgi:hypothetical protein